MIQNMINKTLMINNGGYSKPKMENKGNEEGLIQPAMTDNTYKSMKNTFTQTASFRNNGCFLCIDFKNKGL